MRFLKVIAGMSFITAFFISTPVGAQSGVVQSEIGKRIEDVGVFIADNLLAKTDGNGVFTLPSSVRLPVKLILEHPDYQTKSVNFTVDGQIFSLAAKSEALETVIVYAPKNDKQERTFPSATVTAAAFAQQSPLSIVETLNQTAGAYIQSGAINTNRITIRGVGSRTLYGTNKLKAYYNGFPITNGVGESALDVYNPEQLSSIEIIKGPKSSLYGSNLGGTILLASKLSNNSGISVENSSTIGSFHLFKNSFNVAVSEEKFSLQLSYDHLEKEGFRDNSQYNRNGYFLNYKYRIGAQTEVELLVNSTAYTAQIPSSIGKTDFLKKPYVAAFTWAQAQGYENDKSSLVGLGLNHRFSNTFENQTRLFYTYSDHYEPRPFNILDERTAGFGIRSEFLKTFEFLRGTANWKFGTEVFEDHYKWKTLENNYKENNGNGSLEGALLSNNDESRKHLNIFTSLELPLSKKLKLEAGINFNHTRYEIVDFFNLSDNKRTDRNFEPILAPNATLSYQMSPQNSWFLNVGYGFNYPSLEEALTPDGIVNPEIDPETGINYELGSEAYFFKRTLRFFGSVYRMDIRNLLVAQRVRDDQYIGRNAGRTLHDGMELSANYDLEISPAFRISPYFNASLNWHRFKDFVSEEVDYSGNKLTGTPKGNFASGMGIKYREFSLFFNHLYVGEMPMNDANSLFSDSYSLLNLKMVYNFRFIQDLDLQLNFGINNLSNTAYASSILINATGFNNAEPRYYYPGDPRNYYGGLLLKYLF